MTDKKEKKSEASEKSEAREPLLKGKSPASSEDDKAKRRHDANDSRPKW